MGSNQAPEKTEAEKRAEAEAVPASFRCQMVMAICAVLGLIVYRHVFGWHVLDGPVHFEFDQLTRKNN